MANKEKIKSIVLDLIVFAIFLIGFDVTVYLINSGTLVNNRLGIFGWYLAVTFIGYIYVRFSRK